MDNNLHQHGPLSTYGLLRQASNLEDRAARTIFTERSDKASNNNHDNDELHNELLPALRASQSTPTINTPRSRNSPSRSPSRLGTTDSRRSERWFDGSNPSTAESMMGNKNSNTTKTNTKNRNHNDINHNNIDHNSIDDSFVQLQELKDLGLQRRTKMIEKSRWKNKKNNNKNNNKIHQKDWRQDKSISTDDTPSLSHDLSRLTIDKKWTIQYNREKSSFASAALHNEVRLREVFAATEGMVSSFSSFFFFEIIN